MHKYCSIHFLLVYSDVLFNIWYENEKRFGGIFLSEKQQLFSNLFASHSKEEVSEIVARKKSNNHIKEFDGFRKEVMTEI